MANIKKNSTLGKSKILPINDTSDMVLYPDGLRSRFINLKYANVGVKYNHCSVIHKTFNESVVGDPIEECGIINYVGSGIWPNDFDDNSRSKECPGYEMMPDFSVGLKNNMFYHLSYLNIGNAKKIFGWTYLKTNVHYFRKSVRLISCTFSAKINGYDDDTDHLRQDFKTYYPFDSSNLNGIGLKVLVKNSSDTDSFNYSTHEIEEFHSVTYKSSNDIDGFGDDIVLLRPYSGGDFYKATLVSKVSEFSHSPNAFSICHKITTSDSVIVEAGSLVCGAICFGSSGTDTNQGYFSNFIGKDFNICLEYSLLE